MGKKGGMGLLPIFEFLLPSGLTPKPLKRAIQPHRKETHYSSPFIPTPFIPGSTKKDIPKVGHKTGPGQYLPLPTWSVQLSLGKSL